MIYLTQADREKLKLLDDIFRLISVDIIKQWTEADKIVEVLKGDSVPKPNGVIMQIVTDNQTMSVEIAQIRSDTISLRNSIQAIVRILNRSQFDPLNNGDMVILKTQFGIY